VFVFLRWHLHRRPVLLLEHADRDLFRRGTASSIAMGPVAYAVGAAIAWLNEAAAFACYAAVALYFVFPRRARLTTRRGSTRTGSS